MTTQAPNGISILLVDDEEILLDISRMYLERNSNILVDTAESAEEALEKLSSKSYDVIVSDFDMPEKTGIDLLREVRKMSSDLPFILFTGKGREEIAIEAFNTGVTFYIQKGGEPRSQFTELTHKVQISVEQYRTRQKIVHLYRIFKALLRISDIIHDETSIEDILESVCTIITREGGYHNIRIVLFDDDGNITTSYEKGLNEQFSRILTYLHGGNRTTCYRRALENDGSAIICRPHADCNRCPLYPEHISNIAITARLEYTGTVFGIISVTTSPDTAYDPDELALFREITRTVAYTIHHHSLKEEQNAMENLIALNKKLNIINTITRHDIRNQMTVLVANLDLIREYTNSSPEAQIIHDRMHEAMGNIQEHLLFSEVYHSIGLQKPRWLGISGIIGAIDESHAIHGIRLINSTGPLEIHTDPMFGKILLNLIENAIMHGNGVKTICVDFLQLPDCGILSICDDGTGITPSMKSQIFEKGIGKNTGLGLYLTREILALTGMQISETGVYGEGARFEISIPKRGYRFRKGTEENGAVSFTTVR